MPAVGHEPVTPRKEIRCILAPICSGSYQRIWGQNIFRSLSFKTSSPIAKTADSEQIMCIGETQTLGETAVANAAMRTAGCRRERSEEIIQAHLSGDDFSEQTSSSKRQRGSEAPVRNSWRAEQERILRALTPLSPNLDAAERPFNSLFQDRKFAQQRSSSNKGMEAFSLKDTQGDDETIMRYAGVSSLVAMLDSSSPSSSESVEDDDEQNNLAFLFKYTHVCGGR